VRKPGRALLLVATVWLGGSHLCVVNGTGISTLMASSAAAEKPRHVACTAGRRRSQHSGRRRRQLQAPSVVKSRPGVAHTPRVLAVPGPAATPGRVCGAWWGPAFATAKGASCRKSGSDVEKCTLALAPEVLHTCDVMVM
jgi:hypothetical protein